MKDIIGVVTHPFKIEKKQKKELEEKYNIKFIYLKQNIKKNNKNLIKFLKNCTGIIAGTEKYDSNLINSLLNLKVIFRLGIGVDNIDRQSSKKNNITILNTPNAPSQSTAEYALALILNVIKGCIFSNNKVKKKKWIRFQHLELSHVSIGIIGLGRIGSRVLKLVLKLPFKKIYANDIDKSKYKLIHRKLEYCSKNKIFSNSDVITLHIPLTRYTKNLLSKKNLLKIKKNSNIVNTSRGEIINESDLYKFLKKKYFANVALDVMKNEPYYGNLLDFDNVSITPHNSSMSFQSRHRMVEGTINNIKFFYKKN